MNEQLRPRVERMAAEVARKNGRVPLTKVTPSRWQPRISFDPDELWELAKSIEENGLINPVVVFPVDDHYELVAGERRTRAMFGLAIGNNLDVITPKRAVELAAAVGIEGIWASKVGGGAEDPIGALEGETIRARVMKAPESIDDWQKLHRLAIVENLERANLSPLEEAHGLQGLIESYDWSQRDLARHLGKSQGWVAQRLALLELPKAAQDAVNTRVLTISHARALQGLPEALGDTMTEHVIRRVEKGASSREVSHTVSAVKDFFDVERYEPDPAKIYKPVRRNRLRLLRWLIEVTDWEAESVARETLITDTRLSFDPETMVNKYRFEILTSALGFKNIEDAWKAFAAETHRFCTRCAWDRYDWEGTEWSYDLGSPPCRRMQEADAATCQRYIAQGIDPEIVRISYDIRNALQRLHLCYNSEPFNHIVGIDSFVELFGRVQDAQEQWDQEDAEEAELGHITHIQRYYDWQLSLPMDALEHVQAHACSQCCYYIRDKRSSGEVPCYFVEQPLRGRYATRGPENGAFVTREGLMLPRCEMFAYANRPSIKCVEGTCFPDRDQALGWMRDLAREKASGHRNIWAILQWLDYGRQPGDSGTEQDLNGLTDYLRVLWDMRGNAKLDEQIATLLDVVTSEANARGTIVDLVNPVTGEPEQFIPIGFDLAMGEGTWPHWKDYPDDWPQPWLNEEGEGDDETLPA